MESKQLIKQILEKWKFPILEEKDNVILFRYQMDYIVLAIYDIEDSKVISVSTVVDSFDEHEERTLSCLKICNKLNGELLLAKLQIEDDVSIISDFCYKTENDVEFLLKKSLDSLIDASIQYEELKNDDASIIKA